jgi:hypothetical protein
MTWAQPEKISKQKPISRNLYNPLGVIAVGPPFLTSGEAVLRPQNRGVSFYELNQGNEGSSEGGGVPAKSLNPK